MPTLNQLAAHIRRNATKPMTELESVQHAQWLLKQQAMADEALVQWNRDLADRGDE